MFYFFCSIVIIIFIGHITTTERITIQTITIIESTTTEKTTIKSTYIEKKQ
ncbi:hypothetical protein U3516DRAFT_771498 [Neocallimastix sp. 'constans']